MVSELAAENEKKQKVKTYLNAFVTVGSWFALPFYLQQAPWQYAPAPLVLSSPLLPPFFLPLQWASGILNESNVL